MRHLKQGVAAIVSVVVIAFVMAGMWPQQASGSSPNTQTQNVLVVNSAASPVPVQNDVAQLQRTKRASK